MSAFGGMEQSESLIGTKGGMCHESVSYTHLDVYKRQELITVSIPMRIEITMCIGIFLKHL